MKLTNWIIVSVLLILSALKGYERIRSNGLGDFYSKSYAPAVILSQRGIFPAYYSQKSQKLEDFLTKKVRVLDVEDEKRLSIIEWKQQDLNSIFNFSIQWVIGHLWKIFGANWKVVEYFAIFLWVATLMSIYFLGTVLFNQLIAALLWILILIFDRSLIHYLPEVRDFSKVFFLFFGMGLIYLILFQKRNVWCSVALNFALGIFIGFGVGFRTDTKALIPLYLIFGIYTSLFKKQNSPWHFLIGTLLMISTYWIASAPERHFRGDHSHSAHVAILGQTPEFASSNYSRNHSFWVGLHYMDLLVDDIVSHKGKMVGKKPVYLNSEYEQTGRIYLIGYILDMPYRFLTSILNIPREIFPSAFSFKVILITLSFLLLAYCKPNAGVFLGVSFIYFCALSWIQFHPRHFFHIKIFYFLAIAALVWTLTFAIKDFGKIKAIAAKRSKRDFLIIVVLVSGFTVFSSAAYFYEQKRLDTIVDEYLQLNEIGMLPLSENVPMEEIQLPSEAEALLLIIQAKAGNPGDLSIIYQGSGQTELPPPYPSLNLRIESLRQNIVIPIYIRKDSQYGIPKINLSRALLERVDRIHVKNPAIRTNLYFITNFQAR